MQWNFIIIIGESCLPLNIMEGLIFKHLPIRENFDDQEVIMKYKPFRKKLKPVVVLLLMYSTSISSMCIDFEILNLNRGHVFLALHTQVL